MRERGNERDIIETCQVTLKEEKKERKKERKKENCF